MTTFTISLPDETTLRLNELAIEAGVDPEELLHARVLEWLARPRDDFAQAVAYILKKNSGLYQRFTK